MGMSSCRESIRDVSGGRSSCLFGTAHLARPRGSPPLAYRGLDSYRFIGLGWLMHTGCDTVHHLYGNPIIPMMRMSSAQCAVCDSLLALWFFAGAPAGYRQVGILVNS